MPKKPHRHLTFQELLEKQQKRQEEAERYADGVKPSMKRRSQLNDYYARHFYMITMAVDGRRSLLGTLTGDPEQPLGNPQAPQLVPSPLGDAVTRCFHDISTYYPETYPFMLQLMPDHIHFLLLVKRDTDVHLGSIIKGFKVGCTKAFRALTGEEGSLFETGYNDKIVTAFGKLEAFKRYLNDNPRRAIMKRQNPDFFRVRRDITIERYTLSGLGNHFLLQRPLKARVQLSRRLEAKDIEAEVQRFMALAEGGTVLVSPGISPAEKAVLRAAYERHLPVISILTNGFGEFAKPGGAFFDACAEGRMLFLSPWEHHNEKRKIKREECLYLNDIAAAVCRF